MKARMMIWLGAAVAALALSVPAGAADAPILKELSGAERERVAKLIEGAKKEGNLDYMSHFVQVGTARVMEAEFKRLYGLAGHKFNFSDRTTSIIIRRVEEEIRANKVTADVLLVSSVSWLHSLKRRGELMKYVSPEDKHYAPAEKAKMNGDGHWVADAQLNTISVNQSILPGVTVSSWHDLLNPKFQGKILVGDASRTETYTLVYMGWRQVLPKEFFQKLAAQKTGLILRGPEQRRAVMSGEYAIGTTIMARHNMVAQKEGVKMVPFYPKEGVTALPMMSAILTKAPHPNTARLFIDFYRGVHGKYIQMSREPGNLGRPELPPHPDPKVQAQLKKAYEIAPPIDKLNVIPIDWEKVTPADVKKWQAEFVSIFGKGTK
ncbi:MAG: ABC transporter substrate-binding protein [Candidatus Tectomicrobia bacterium]|uniref:ABC transporter substrate-binding protein n=1 Tax=Tectimicrobiota bacterium TaxID=2528274 RepID=A0A932I0Y4_UNCTE|nr:ABC transporter substrate-binding protein [Candidatus Tectomicrobia bacterium]